MTSKRFTHGGRIDTQDRGGYVRGPWGSPSARTCAHVSARIETVARPYLLTFRASGHTYPLTSEDAQRLIDAYPAVSATSQRVVLRGDDGTRSEIRPATRGGGIAFVVERERGGRGGRGGRA